MADPSARFTEMFHASYAPLCAYVARRVPADDVADVVAEVFTVAWTHLEQVPDPALPWLYRTAWHAIGNHRRRQARHGRLIDRVAAQPEARKHGRDPGDGVVAAQLVQQALARLSPADREAIQLLCWEQLSIADAALVLACSPATLRVRLHRARRRLATVLSELADNDAPAEADLLIIERTTS